MGGKNRNDSLSRFFQPYADSARLTPSLWFCSLETIQLICALASEAHESVQSSVMKENVRVALHMGVISVLLPCISGKLEACKIATWDQVQGTE